MLSHYGFVLLLSLGEFNLGTLLSHRLPGGQRHYLQTVCQGNDGVLEVRVQGLLHLPPFQLGHPGCLALHPLLRKSPLTPAQSQPLQNAPGPPSLHPPLHSLLRRPYLLPNRPLPLLQWPLLRHHPLPRPHHRYPLLSPQSSKPSSTATAAGTSSSSTSSTTSAISQASSLPSTSSLTSEATASTSSSPTWSLSSSVPSQWLSSFSASPTTPLPDTSFETSSRMYSHPPHARLNSFCARSTSLKPPSL